MMHQKYSLSPRQCTLLDLSPFEAVREAYLLVKRSYDIAADGRAVCSEPEPLEYDFRDPACRPRLHPGTDYWPRKEATDVVVRGSAWAPGGRPVESMTARVTIGERAKSVRVSGRRVIGWGADGSPRFPDPEPFLEMPLGYENAYGGFDKRVRTLAEPTLARFVGTSLGLDHPGLYPRNPFGKGYLVVPEPWPGMELPNLEDPSDFLHEDRLFVRDPERWYEQPLPWSFDWVSAATFPRHLFFGAGVDAWFPGPDDARLPEVRRGLVPAGYRALMAEHAGVHPRFFQEASLGLVVGGLRSGELLRVEGMHPSGSAVEVRLPVFPELAFELDGGRREVGARLHHVVVEPAVKRLHLVFGATVELPRLFLPGVHPSIPIAVRIDDDAPLRFAAPRTLRAVLGGGPRA